MFCGLRGDFRDLMTRLSIKAKPISYTDLHNYLLTHEFLYKASFQPAVTALLLLMPSQLSSTFLLWCQLGSPSSNYNQNYISRGRFHGGWKNNNLGNN